MPVEHVVRCEVKGCGEQAAAIEKFGTFSHYHQHPQGWSELTIEAEPTKDEKKAGNETVQRHVTLCPVHTLRASGD